ncbi:erythromycin esterase family protein [Peribacillus sp. NPDC097675]|uniref:erythromycin esterase family protein n=1 Tax=Peribacillus sp. NPDC097675 TaxID=3390618 RepID=UPI003D05E8EB
MRSSIKTFLALSTIICLVLMGWYVYQYSLKIEKAEWWVNNTHNIDTTNNDDDLKFLDSILKGKKYVFLGENSHGVAEYNTAKGRLIKYLHENQDYDVVAFESNLADPAVTFAELHTSHISSRTYMQRTIPGVWNATQNLPLFDYILENRREEKALVNTGFDIQPFGRTFTNFTTDWITKRSPSKGDLFSKLEKDWLILYLSFYEGGRLSNQDVLQFQEGYSEIISFITHHGIALKHEYPNQPKLNLLILQTLQNRIELMTRMSKTNYSIDEMSTVRDSLMAENIKWLSEKIYPDKKIIFWAHNAHIRNHNTKITYKDEGETEFRPFLHKTMFEYLPDDFKKQSYILGFYMYDGEFSDNQNNIKKVNDGKDYQADSLEQILNQSNFEQTFINLNGQTKNKFNKWMFEPVYALTQGLYPEKMVVSNHYDGLFFIKHVKPTTYIR